MERMATSAALRTVAGEDSLAVGMRGAFAAARYIPTPCLSVGVLDCDHHFGALACLSQGAHKDDEISVDCPAWVLSCRNLCGARRLCSRHGSRYLWEKCATMRSGTQR
jgi:hypothetical protein